MRLILSGGGNKEETKEINKLFASLLNKKKFLLYIPIAMDTKKHSYPDCLNWIKGVFENLKVERYEMWTEEEMKNIEGKDIKKFGGIYIGGGNTPYLLKTLREMNFLEFLEKAILQNVPVYGGSAGATIFGNTIIPSLSSDENFVRLKDFSAMNKLSGYDIWCHYKKENDKKIKEFIKKYKLKKIIALSEKSGLYLYGKKIKVIGKESVFVFSSNKKIEFEVDSFLN